MRTYLIVGGGVSGATAAAALAAAGHRVQWIEAGNRLGGAVLEYGCKATDECSRCGVCVAHTQLQAALQHEQVQASVGAIIHSVSFQDHSVTATAVRHNPAIAYQDCLFCDQCVQACPEGCITKVQHGEFVQYAIEYKRCRLHQGQPCGLCAAACPTNAITAEAATTDLTLTADAALVATGHAAYDATAMLRLGYGRFDNVLTGLEAEAILDRQLALGESRRNIAFIQCVGSRNPQIGRNYCSGVCCAYALRLARVIKHRTPDVQVTIYYIDLQNIDKTFTLFRQSVEASGVQLVRGVPQAVERSTDGRLHLYIESEHGEETRAEHDLVVLSVGLGPQADAPRVAELFGLQQDQFGFFTSPQPGVFVSGTCQQPLNIPDSMAAARATALEMQVLSACFS
jgi:heterodisulfide reductase subunit A-like polyferredoxin